MSRFLLIIFMLFSVAQAQEKNKDFVILAPARHDTSIVWSAYNAEIDIGTDSETFAIWRDSLWFVRDEEKALNTILKFLPKMIYDAQKYQHWYYAALGIIECIKIDGQIPDKQKFYEAVKHFRKVIGAEYVEPDPNKPAFKK